MLDFSEPENKKYIPLATFALGMFVGALLHHFYMQHKAKNGSLFSSGGSVGGGGSQQPQSVAQPQPIVISAQPAVVAPAVSAPVAVAGTQIPI